MSTYRSRATSSESMLDELFGTSGLEGDLPPTEPDPGFPLRPFAAAMPMDDLTVTEPRTDESPAERLFRRAMEAASRGRASEAIHRYRELLQLDPSHVSARNNLSQLLDTTGDPEEALEQLTAALRVTPDDVHLLVSRGAINGRLKRYVEAEGDLRKALRLSPESMNAHLTLGMVLWRKGMAMPAAEALRKAISLEPTHAAAHYYLGEALNQAGDYRNARAALERALELAPAQGRTLRLLGRVLDRLKLPDEAQVMYRRARDAGDT